MAQLKDATEKLEEQIAASLAANRVEVLEPIESRKTEMMGSTDFHNASTDAQQSVVGAIDDLIGRVEGERQIGLIRALGYSFVENTYPALLDQLAAAAKSFDDGGGTAKPMKQTVSVKTIDVPGAPQVLETIEDVELYLSALRNALLSTINDDGKRIAL